jgi:hypothetical protein
MDDRIALRTVVELLGVTPRSVTDMARRGELTRKLGPFGWEYSHTEVLELARKRERLYGPPSPGRRRGRPRRVQLAEQVNA